MDQQYQKTKIGIKMKL